MTNLHEIGRLPAPGDNCTIAIRTLAAGTAVRADDTQFLLSHTILEGHRFAAQPIPAGTYLLSWGMPFGRALRDINPGEYVCNQRVLDELSLRSLEFELPIEPNFADDLAKYEIDAGRIQPPPPLSRKPDPRTFMGFRRPGNRGVGTRNMIVLLGVNALVGGYVQRLEKEMQSLAAQYDNIDGVVAVAHSEGSQAGNNNETLLLRTLAGFLLHSNVAAVLSVDAGDTGVTNGMLRQFSVTNGYSLDNVLNQFMSLRGPFAEDLQRGMGILSSWLPRVNAMQRTPQPLGELKIALQCGGSDAFSGISGNPLAALVAKYVIQAGGSAVLAETDELIGAESYLLKNVRDAATAHKFLETVAHFQERVAWHGHSAQGNPTGGNRYRGLYNIYLKSLGAAVKRHPEVPLDYVIEYGQRMNKPGYYFMDSPGNDLESIAGQAASGCNLIFFITGNGSITNFPFVPTIKIVTTSERYALLSAEMDVNAGAYLDGAPLEELAGDMLDLSLAVASGRHSAGEKAGHAQVQIWRNWQLTGHKKSDRTRDPSPPDGQPLPISPPARLIDMSCAAWQTKTGIVSDRVGLILPSSLCSAQIAQMAAQRLNENAVGKEKQISRFAALVHTEGCGNSTQPEFVNSLLGYLSHPLAVTCLILEHGCEITHNDFWRQQLRKVGLDPEQFGWASVQMDGGIRNTLAKIDNWFTADCARLDTPQAVTSDFSTTSIGLMTAGTVDQQTAVSLAYTTQQIAAVGGTVILPANDPLAANRAFADTLHVDLSSSSTLAYAQQPPHPGFHIMANPASQWSETLTGLGAAGVELVLALVTTRAQQAHPFIPVLQVVANTDASHPFHADVDLILHGPPRQRLAQMIAAVSAVLSRSMQPKQNRMSNIGFQITRGQLGVSL